MKALGLENNMRGRVAQPREEGSGRRHYLGAASAEEQGKD